MVDPLPTSHEASMKMTKAPRAAGAVRQCALRGRTLLLVLMTWASVVPVWAQLPSWNEGPARARILAFVQAVIDKSGKDYVEPARRVAGVQR